MTHPYLRTLLFIIALAAISNNAAPQSITSARAAFADRSSFPREAWPYIYHIDTDPWVGEERADLEAAITFMVCSTSLEPIIERTKPVALPGTSLLRMDLRELGWNYDDWRAVLSHYPYFPGGFCQVIRGDWLLVELADMQDSQSGAYMRLLLGGKDAPKKIDDVLTRLGVGNEQKNVFGIVEGESGVAIRKGGRIIESRPIQRGYCYITRDVLRLTKDRNPLENLLDVSKGIAKHDGSEIIVMLPKISNDTGDRGALPYYFLADGSGNLVNRAPVDLVEDFKKFRGFAEIRFPGACFVSCHSTGYNMPTRHEFRELTEKGIVPYTEDPEAARDIHEFFVSELTKEIERANDDQQTITTLLTGLQHGDLAAAFRRSVDRYDASLDMQAVAEEFVRHGWEVQDVIGAIEVAANQGRIGIALAGISRNRPIDREAFEEGYLKLLSEIASQFGDN